MSTERTASSPAVGVAGETTEQDHNEHDQRTNTSTDTLPPPPSSSTSTSTTPMTSSSTSSSLQGGGEEPSPTDVATTDQQHHIQRHYIDLDEEIRILDDYDEDIVVDLDNDDDTKIIATTASPSSNHHRTTDSDLLAIREDDDNGSDTSTEWSIDLDAAEKGGTAPESFGAADDDVVVAAEAVGAVHIHQHSHDSALEKSMSPFAKRKGKCLWFRNVTLQVASAASKQSHGLLPCMKKKQKADEDIIIDVEGASSSKQRQQQHDDTLSDELSEARPYILKDCWGSAPAGQVTAILGSSGSGKTSLLNVLSGRMINQQNNLNLQLEMKLDDTIVDPSHIEIRKLIAFVAQDDSLPVTATPREAILFSARLRLPKHHSLQELQQLTEIMLEELRLKHCANTFVGGPTLKGISGGERKRTSVGVELVTQPSLVFLDEATSGLDSYNALELVSVLKKVALAGSSVLTTIHQPSSEIFTSLDNLIVLEQGQVLYGGKTNEVPRFFREHGYPCPSHYNPADWILNVAQTKSKSDLEARGFFVVPSDDSKVMGTSGSSGAATLTGTTTELTRRRRTTATTKRESSVAALVAASLRDQQLPRPGLLMQTRLLFGRELSNVIRNKKNLGARTGMTLVSSVLGGIIFFQVAKTDFTEFINVQSTFGALLMSCLANVFSTAIPSLVAFPEERPVFIREYSTNHYSVTAYFASRLTMEAVVTAGQVCLSTVLTYFLIGYSAQYGVFWAICYALAMTSTALGVLLGCAVKDPGMAIEFLPLIMMPQILFAGFFVPPQLIPVWLRWLQYVFPLTYAVKLIAVAEFDHACDGLNPNYCESVLTNLKANPDDVWWYWIILVGQFLIFRLVALILLRHRASQFY